jgi:hypothetical protein
MQQQGQSGSRAFADYFGARRDAVRRTAYLLCGDQHGHRERLRTGQTQRRHIPQLHPGLTMARCTLIMARIGIVVPGQGRRRTSGW